MNPIDLTGLAKNAVSGAASTAGKVAGDVAAGAVKATVGDAGGAVSALTAGASQLATRAGLFAAGLVLLIVGLWAVVKA